MAKPTLSVIMTNYNHGRFLPDSLGAILNQSYRPAEIIILDDASTDNSVEIIESFAKREPLIRFLRNQQNMGPLNNIHRLMELVSGDYIYGAAADDKILPGFLEQSMNLLGKYPQAGLCSTLSRSIDEKGRDRGVFPSPVVAGKPAFIPASEARQLLDKYGSWIKGNSVIYRRNALLAAGGFIAELKSYTDGFIQQVIALRHGACFIPQPLSCFREMATNYSATTFGDIASAIDIGKKAKELMRTRYNEVFTPEYINKWEYRFLWSARVAGWYAISRSREQYLVRNSPGSESQPFFFDSIFSPCLRFFIRMQGIAIMLYWGCKYKVLHNWLWRRWLKRAKNSHYPAH